MKKLLFLLGFATVISCGSSTPDDSDIKQAARAAILSNVKDPTSTTFHQNEVVKNLGENVYSYSETINATNGFGGSIAQNIFVKIKWTGTDPSEVSSYQLVDLQYSDR